jgi:hypothetical protein
MSGLESDVWQALHTRTEMVLQQRASTHSSGSLGVALATEKTCELRIRAFGHADSMLYPATWKRKSMKKAYRGIKRHPRSWQDDAFHVNEPVTGHSALLHQSLLPV